MEIEGKMIESASIASQVTTPLSRRCFVGIAALAGVDVGIAALSGEALGQHAMPSQEHMAEEIKKEKIRRAFLAGPSSVTSEATVAAT